MVLLMKTSTSSGFFHLTSDDFTLQFYHRVLHSSVMLWCVAKWDWELVRLENMWMCSSDQKIGKPAASQETGNHSGSWGSSDSSLAINPQQWSHSSHGYYAAHRYNPQEILYQVQSSIRKPKQSHPPTEHTLCLVRKREGKWAGIIDWKKKKTTFILGCVPLWRQLIYVQEKKNGCVFVFMLSLFLFK